MYLKQLNRLFFASMISICTANVVFAETKKSDITHDVVGFEESAYGEHKGYVATKSSTGSKMDISIAEIPQSVKVFTRDMMNDRAVQSLQNITSYDASIAQVYGENNEARTDYSRIRGIDHVYKSSFLDGLKLIYAHHLIPKIDPYALERVELLKGPSSVLYGASGPGGLVNMQTKKPNGTDEKEIGVSYGTHSNKTVFTDFNHKVNDNVLLRFTGKHKKGDNELQHSTNESYFFDSSLRYLIDDETTLDLRASIAKDQIKGLGLGFNGGKAKMNYHNGVAEHANTFDALFGGGAGVLAAALRNSASQVDALNLPSNLFIGSKDDEIFQKEHKYISATLTKNLNDKMKINSSLRAKRMDGKTHYSVASFSQFQANLAAQRPLSMVPLEFTETDSKMSSFAWDSNLEYKWNTQRTENTSLFGADVQYFSSNQTVKDPVLYNFDVTNPNAAINLTRANTLKSDIDLQNSQLGLYASNSMKIDDKFVISTSLRFDKIKDEIKKNKTNTKDNYSEDNISGRVGLVYLMDNGASPYVTYSTSFQGNTGTDKNGTAFKPTTGKQVEVGVKYQPKNIDALITLAAFSLEQNDVVKTDPTATAYKIQQGDNKVKGIEFNIVATPTDNTNVTVSLAKMDGTQENTPYSYLNGGDIGELPEFIAAIWADYTFQNTKAGDVKVGAGYKYIGDSTYFRQDYFNLPTQPIRKYDVPSYSIVDAMVATKYNDWDVSFNVYNVFDERSPLAVNSISEGETSGRTYKLTASYKF